MKEVRPIKISSGTLRKKFNEALDHNIICQNALLMVLAAMNSDKTYTDNDKQKKAQKLIQHNCTKEYILRVVPQISDKYWPAKHQISRLQSVLEGSYTFRRYYIADSFLKSVDWDDIPGKQPNKESYSHDRGKALKQYIYENQLVELVLEKMGCENIQYHTHKDYWSCSNPGGDNRSAVNIYNTPYLYVKNRSKHYDADLITFIELSLAMSFKETLGFLYEVLKLHSDDPALITAHKNYLDNETEREEQDEVGIVQPITYMDEAELLRYVPLLHIDWYRDSIMPWTRDKFGLRYSYTMQRVVIPLRYYATGYLMGFNSRTTIDNYELFDIKKYFLSPGYQKNQNIYGLWENKKAIKEIGYVIVFEGCRSVLKLDTLYQRTPDGMDKSVGVALLGCELSETQAQILLDLDVDIVISLDKDRSIGELRHCCEQLRGRTNRNIYYTWDTESLLGEKDAAIDKGKAVFEKILSHKVLYNEEEHAKYLENIGRTA